MNLADHRTAARSDRLPTNCPVAEPWDDDPFMPIP